MRADQCPPSRQIAHAVIGKRLTQPPGGGGHVADQIKCGGRKGGFGLRLRFGDRLKGSNTVGVDRASGFGHLLFQRDIPRRFAHHIFEQAVAFPHGLFVGQRLICMVRQKAECHAVKETAAPFGPFDPKTVHRRDQPQHPRNAP